MEKRGMMWVLLVGALWIVTVYDSVLAGSCYGQDRARSQCLKHCLTEGKPAILVPDNFTGFIKAQEHMQQDGCILFLQRQGSATPTTIQQPYRHLWPELQKMNGYYHLSISKWHINRGFIVYLLNGTGCNKTVQEFTVNKTCPSIRVSGNCTVNCYDLTTVCNNTVYDEEYCSTTTLKIKNRFIINVSSTAGKCWNCDSPVKKPETEVTLDNKVWNGTVSNQAAEAMKSLASFATTLNESLVAVSMGDDITGILVKQTEPEDVEEVSFAYKSQNDSLSIVEKRADLAKFSRSVTVTKEAFLKSFSSNVSVPFAAVFRMLNLGQDEMNSTILGDEILTVEMGTVITNLTDKININFWDVKYTGIPTCHSWNGEGGRPNWTVEGCHTVTFGGNITCQCSHLTFFAILLTPLNETISTSDLNNLTIITQVGCGLSMFFLSIILFMHFLLRRSKSTTAMRFLIQLVAAMFLLNLTFLINSYIANLKSNVGCKIMAAIMHYFMLATFTWFAVQALHICLQVYAGGKVAIQRYVLKVSIISWVLPGTFVIILLVLGKYGEQMIYTDNIEDSVAMCWITDYNVHFIVNIGYYALVFLFTFSTFITILLWLFFLRKRKAAAAQMSDKGITITTIFGLCCVLGISWGFAFFAYGVLRIPAYYIFTALNSFQGFFLFIHYYSIRHSQETNTDGGVKSSTSSSSSTTLTSGLDVLKNPYIQESPKT